MKTILFSIRVDQSATKAIYADKPGQNDQPYLPLLKKLIGGRAVIKLDSTPSPTMLFELVMKAQKVGASAIATTNQKILALLTGNPKASLDDYAGSIFTNSGMEWLILNPCEHLVTVPYGGFLYERYWSKLLRPEDWFKIPDFKWTLFEPKDATRWLDFFKDCTFISSDIETGKEEERIITCIGFTGVRICPTTRTFTVATVVVPFSDTFNVSYARTLLQLSTPKLFQNGQYDNAYLLRYNSPTNNWAFDTQSLFHSWYSELPKRLDFITSFTLRDWIFWKDESQTSDILQYYEYNAKDCFGTAMAFLSLVQEMPEWAFKNDSMKFLVNYACLAAGMTGLKINPERQEALKVRVEKIMATKLEAIKTMVACKSFNPSSPPQTAKLFAILGCKDIKGTGKVPRDKVASRHPLNKRIVKQIGEYREERKLSSSYIGKDFVWHDRLFFQLRPDGTDTGRLASSESQFWCGLQIQNWPRGDKGSAHPKEMVESDSDFHFGECDYSQAEARDTAYISGDLNLINAVEDQSKDFHGRNAASFFGLNYEEIVKTELGADGKYRHDTLNKPIRQISKNTNHGSNYNIGASKLIDTMTIENVIKARHLLKLPQNWQLKQVTQYLLDGYEKAYPVVKGDWYDSIIKTVNTSHLLVGATGWTRYCFGTPSRTAGKDKHDLNRYVAHPPQSLNAMTLNIAYYKVFVEVYLPNVKNFKLGPQIHDSILFQYRKGYEHLAFQVKEIMEGVNPEVTDTYGIKRILKVPVDLKGKHNVWSKLQTMEVTDLFTIIPVIMPEILFEKM